MEKFVNRKYFEWKKFIIYPPPASTHSFPEKVSHIREKYGVDRNTWSVGGKKGTKNALLFVCRNPQKSTLFSAFLVFAP